MKCETTPKFDKLLKKNPALRPLAAGLKQKIESSTEQQLRDSGTHLEPIRTNPPFLSIKASGGMRAICLVQGDVLILHDIPESHEKAYRKGSVNEIVEMLKEVWP
jgi:hypothetical protein